MLPPALHWWWENGVKVYGGMFIRSFVPIWRPCQWHRPTERQARKDNPTDDNISSDGSSSDVPVDMPDKTFSALLWWAMGCARWWSIVSPSAVPPTLPLFVVPKRHHIIGLLGRQQRRWWVVVNLPWTVYRLSSKQYSKPREMFLPISITSFLIFYVIHPSIHTTKRWVSFLIHGVSIDNHKKATTVTLATKPSSWWDTQKLTKSEADNGEFSLKLSVLSQPLSVPMIMSIGWRYVRLRVSCWLVA